MNRDVIIKSRKKNYIKKNSCPNIVQGEAFYILFTDDVFSKKWKLIKVLLITIWLECNNNMRFNEV